LTKYSKPEKAAVRDYSVRELGAKINGVLRGTLDPNDPNNAGAQRSGEVIRSAIPKYALEKDTLLYRGADDYKKLFYGKMPIVGDKITWSGFASSSIDRNVSEKYAKNGQDRVIVEMAVPKGTHGVPMGNKRLSAEITDKEFLLDHKTTIKVISVEKTKAGLFVKAKVIRK
jgi:hypothetical protein